MMRADLFREWRSGAEEMSAKRLGIRPSLSICIALKNRAKVPSPHGTLFILERCLEAIYDANRDARHAESGPFGRIEVVIVDFGSTDGPRDHLHKLDGYMKVPVRWVDVDAPFSRGRGLNIAAMHAKHELLFLMDADMLVTGGTLARACQVAAAGGAYFPVCWSLHEPQPEGGQDGWIRTSGWGNVALHRGLLQAAGGVPDYDAWGKEDEHLRDRLEEGGARVVREVARGFVHQWHPDEVKHKNYTGGYRQMEFFKNRIPTQREGVFLDLGAFEFDVARHVLQTTRLKVHAFDMVADRRRQRELEWRFRGRFRFWNAAVGTQERDMVKVWGDGEGRTAFRPRETDDPERFMRVPSIDLARWIGRNLDRGDFIAVKMDIEGSEYQVLEELLRARIFHWIDLWFIDWHDCQFGLLDSGPLRQSFAAARCKSFHWCPQRGDITDVSG